MPRCLKPGPGADNHNEVGETEQLFAVLPHVDLFQRIGPQNEECFTVFRLLERTQGVDCVGWTLRRDFHVRDLEKWVILARKNGHVETILGWGYVQGVVLVGGNEAWDERDPVELMQPGHLLGQAKMPQVRRIEGPSKDSHTLSAAGS